MKISNMAFFKMKRFIHKLIFDYVHQIDSKIFREDIVPCPKYVEQGI